MKEKYERNKPFPDIELMYEAINREYGSPLYEGDFEVAVWLLSTNGEEAMWNYFDKRLCEIFDKIDSKLTRTIRE